jgi:hypothetical protein
MPSASQKLPLVVPFSKLTTNAMNLPRLPIPALKDTARRYEASVRAIKKKSTIDNHMAVFNKFLETDAAKIQKVLVHQDRTHQEAGQYPYSFIEQQWDDGYLKYRGPSPVNIAPAFTLHALGDRIRKLVEADAISQTPGDTRPTVQCYTAAYMVHGLLRFAQKMLEDGLDVISEPLFDLSQMTKQFGFTRLAKDTRDSVKYTPLPDAMGHLAVMHRGRVFNVPLRDKTGNYYTPRHLAQSFRHIINSTPAQGEYSIGALTGASRDEWASIRRLLENSHDSNANNFEVIDSAFTVLCLDVTEWGQSTDRILPGMLTGATEGLSTGKNNRVSDDVVNRWYDKHQLIVDASVDGRVGCNFEHAFSDGLTWSRYMTEVYTDLVGKPSGYSPLPKLQDASATTDAPKASELQWNVGDPKCQVATSARNAVEVLNRLCRGLKHAAVDIPYGKAALKKLNISPDAFCQSAYHLAFYRIHGRLAPTYESCSTARYFHGRTETIRTATLPMYQLCSTPELLSGASGGALSTEKKDALRKVLAQVSTTHSQLAKEASVGEGIDRHLLAMREVCREEDSQTGLAFFNEHVYEFSGTWLMSTSNVSQPIIDWFNFGPVVGDGYGIGYNIQNDGVHATVTALESRNSKANAMAQEIVTAAHDLANILQTK